VAVGAIGLFAPLTLGVGYSNITNSLSGQLPIYVLINLCFWKFMSWAISLGSGTSGGTLAPLLTIGSSIGCLLGIVGQTYFPEAGIVLPLAALVGMAALFAGSARALLTSIVFAMETTMQESTLLPLIAGCVTAYIVSFVMMKTTIMTEKISRRGIKLPDSYHPDLLEVQSIQELLQWREKEKVPLIKASLSISDLLVWFRENGVTYHYSTILIVDDNDSVIGAVDQHTLLSNDFNGSAKVSSIISKKIHAVYDDNSLHLAVEFMLKTGQDFVPVVDRVSRRLTGIISDRDILKLFGQRFRDEKHKSRHISITQSTKRIVNKGRYIFERVSR